jgi:hypothetical protein
MEIKQISILNETDLHYKVVHFIRNYLKEPIIIPGLGEYQSTHHLRNDAFQKGYLGGQPDIILLNYHTRYNGLCVEFKSPSGKGVVSEKQNNYLNALENNNYKTLISNDYDEIIVQIMKYSQGIRYLCKYCKRKFTRTHTRDKHYQYFHRINK